MATILGKDPATYPKERDGFLRDLQHFHETRGTPFRRPPIIGGKEVDLYLLYNLVISHGGWIKVNSKNGWSELLEELNLPKECVNGSVALKQTYLRYLDRWEKVHFLGEEADRGSDDDEESRHKRWSARALHSVPLTYNYIQHAIADANREYNHLSADLYKPSDYDKLALSLLSPLPNEQDFAINVCTLLSNDGKHTLKLEKHPRLIDYLLGHAGVFCHGSLRKLFVHCYRNIRKHSILTFWNDVLESNDFLDLTNEEKFNQQDNCKKVGDNSGSGGGGGGIVVDDDGDEKSKSDMMDIDDDICDIYSVLDKDSDLKNFKDRLRLKLKLEPSDRELFCLGRQLGTQDYLGQRVLQITTILRNLSFTEENVPVLIKNRTFHRFLLLCASSRWGYLKNLGMDMLGNVAGEILIKSYPNDRLAKVLLKIITNGLKSEDRAACITSLEVLNKLSQNEANEETLLKCLEVEVFEKVCSFLTIHDVMLLIYTLECLYSLSSLGERSCNLIISNHGVVDTLVSLVTVEGKSYGPKACIGMKLVETVPGGISTTTTTQSVSSTSVNTSTSTTTATSSAPTTTTTTTTSSNLINTLSSTIVNTSTSLTSCVTTKLSTNITTTPVRTVQLTPQRLLNISPSPTTSSSSSLSAASAAAATGVTTMTTTTNQSQSMTPQQLIQQQHAHQQAIHENEQFALAWLRANYEPCINSKVDHQELYKQYLNSCSKIGRRGVISPLHFPRCVRSVFGGTVGPNPMKSSNSNESQYYEGIKVRAQPLIINIQQPNSNPIVTQPISKGANNRRKSSTTTTTILSTPTTTTTATTSPCLSIVAAADNNNTLINDQSQMSPASPILKAQLSAPPKQRDTTAPPITTSKGDIKSQVMAHPHLSQALLGNNNNTTNANTSNSKENQVAGQSNTSLIKSLLATKVNDCMTTVSMRTATDCQNVAQVAARQQQQRLLAQQVTTTPSISIDTNKNLTKLDPSSKASRINGVRQLFADSDGKKEPPQPPPPPLTPLSSTLSSTSLSSSSTTTTAVLVTKVKNRLENEDSDSTGNNSIASSSGIGTVGIGGVSSTDGDGDNSLTSFEGLLNGVPNIDNPLLNEDSNNSKDSVNRVVHNEITKNKPLRLADLLEKKIEKPPPLLNGSLGKELRLGDRTLDLVENHIEKALNNIDKRTMDVSNNENKSNLKRSASDDIVESEPKKPLLNSNINGSTTSVADSPAAPDSVSSSNGDEANTTVSTAAAKLFADFAADILEDEDEEQLLQEAQPQTPQTEIAVPPPPVSSASSTPVQQIIVDNNQQVLLTQPRQIIVTQSQLQSNATLTAGTPIKTQTGQTVIVQNSNQQRTPVVLQQNTGQILLSQGLQGQVQLVASTTQPGQYLLQTSGTQNTYVVAQPQTAVVHGQPQTVLVAQTAQQQGSGTKTIIILQQQAPQSSATHHQKVMVTPQGQQVVVTQVHRPVLQQSTVTNNIIPATSVIKTTPITAITTQTTTINGVGNNSEKKCEETKPKLVRDLTTPFVCEWGDCNIDIKFKSANQVYLHVCEAHCPKGSEEIVCQWERCDNMKRKRFSLMTHLHDKHCNTEAMKQGLVRRKQISQGGKVDPPPPTPTTPHPGYAPDAALHAIKRHALEFVNPKELQDDNEGPVTKSIRLTASLILRNLVIYSTNCRRYLKHYEPHLANVALSNVESSRTIAQVLYDMNEGTNR